MLDVQIDYAADDSCMIQLWAKGTHQQEYFLAACEKALREWNERDVSLRGMPVKYCHYRTVQADAETKAYGVCDTVRIESKPGRGAYAATVLDHWLPLHNVEFSGDAPLHGAASAGTQGYACDDKGEQK